MEAVINFMLQFIWALLQPIILIMAILLIIYLIVNAMTKKGEEPPKILLMITQIIQAFIPDSKNDNAQDEYQSKNLLTKYEWKNYMGMRKFVASHGLIVCPKIRLADLVEPRNDSNKSEWQSRFNRIKSKHVDFVLCDPEMHVKLIVELDDNSHSREDRQERDEFVDAVLTGAGYKIVHIHQFDDAAVEAIEEALKPEAAPAGEQG